MASTGVSQAAEAGTRRPLLALGLVGAGLALAWAWLANAPALAEHLAGSVAGESLAVMLTVFYIVVFVPVGLLAVILARFGGMRAGRMGRHPIAGFFGGIAIGAGALALALALSGLAVAVGRGGQETGLNALAALGLTLIFMQVLAEELLVRGMVQPLLESALGAIAAIILASIAFALLHLAAAGASAFELLNLTLAGMLFGALRFVSGGLALPTGAHFGWNALEDVGLGAFPNPGVGGFGALLDIDLVGQLHWGGGPHGLNASIGTAVVLVAVILSVVALGKGPDAQ